MILRARHVGVGFSEDIHNCDVALQCYVAAKCKMQYIQSTKTSSQKLGRHALHRVRSV